MTRPDDQGRPPKQGLLESGRAAIRQGLAAFKEGYEEGKAESQRGSPPEPPPPVTRTPSSPPSLLPPSETRDQFFELSKILASEAKNVRYQVRRCYPQLTDAEWFDMWAGCADPPGLLRLIGTSDGDDATGLFVAMTNLILAFYRCKASLLSPTGETSLEEDAAHGFAALRLYFSFLAEDLAAG